MVRLVCCVLLTGAAFASMAACSDKAAPEASASDAGHADDAIVVDVAPGDAGSDEGVPVIEIDCSAAAQPQHLFCTGLYADWESKALAPGVMAYDPGYHLWSDGAEKSRFISLPPGTQIDTSNMDEWTFPVGTKFWKQFAFGSRIVETRLLEKLPGTRTWRRVAFRWKTDQSSATELKQGEVNVDGTSYEIPSSGACDLCHRGRIDGVLGFEAIGLASPRASGLTMTELVARKLVTKAPTAPIVVPGDAQTSEALGYLHANCGIACHSQSLYADANYIGLWMRLTTDHLAAPDDTDTYKTAVGQVSQFQIAGSDAGLLYRILPKQPERSAVVIRAGTRDAALKVQMPPLITHEIDDAGLQALQTWINGL